MVACDKISRPLATGGSGISKSALAELSASIVAVIFMFASLTVQVKVEGMSMYYTPRKRKNVTN